jgi:hypothetical protein
LGLECIFRFCGGYDSGLFLHNFLPKRCAKNFLPKGFATNVEPRTRNYFPWTRTQATRVGRSVAGIKLFPIAKEVGKPLFFRRPFSFSGILKEICPGYQKEASCTVLLARI